jgi:hypothetical protein
MRLTLRSLLAYMDELLEPADAQLLAQKIEESEFAKNLMHRTRDVARRLRLAAPKVEGRGMGLDPNTVAEYLDHALPTERVPDFEKVCLESDVHLAEVACCHHILTLVLGEPAEVDPVSRQRMYGLIHRGEESAAAATGATAAAAEGIAAGAAAASDVEPKTTRPAPEIPEYLREPTTRRPLVAWILAAVILIAIGLMFVPQVRNPIIHLVLGNPQEPAPDDNLGPGQHPDQQHPDDKNSTPPGKMPLDGGTTPTPPNVATNPGELRIPEERPLVQPNPTNTSAPTAPSPPETTTSIPATTIPATVTPSTTTPTTIPPATPPVTPPVVATTPSPGAPAPANPLGPQVPVAPPQPMPPQPVPPAVPAQGIGRLISEHVVLLELDVKSGTWQRMPAGDTLYPGDKLLALPAERANVSLSIGISVWLLSGTAAELEAPDEQGIPGIHIVEGRLVLLNTGKAGTPIRVRAGDRQGILVLADGSSTAALEVRRNLPDGVNPETEPATTTFDLFAKSGEVRWIGASGRQESLQAPAVRSLSGPPTVGVAPNVAPVSLPSWLDSDNLSSIEKRASSTIEEYLKPDRSVSLSLKELAEDRRQEVSTLSLLCLALIGEFDPFVPRLNDDKQYKAWYGPLGLVDILHGSIIRSPGLAMRVREAFEKRHPGPKAADLYRLLWGFNQKDLAAGADVRLVKDLDHEDLDFRVLAFWNLKRIKGYTLLYNPHDSAQKRAPAVQKWKQKLEAGDISRPAEG